MSVQQLIRKKSFQIGASIGACVLVGGALAYTFKGQLSQLVFANTLGELDHVPDVPKVQLLPVMTNDELVGGPKDPNENARRQVETYRTANCRPDKISRFDKRVGIAPYSTPVYEFPEDFSSRPEYEALGTGCTNYQVLAYSRRPFLLSAQFNNGSSWVKWAKSNSRATQLWEADLVKYFLADFTGFAVLSRDALGLDKVAADIVENFLGDLFAAGPTFHYQHEVGRQGWVISLPKEKAKSTLKALLLFARQSLQRIYERPQGGEKIYEWLVLDKKIFVTETRDELLLGTGLGSLVSYQAIETKRWTTAEPGDAVFTLRLDALLGSLIPVLQDKPQDTLSKMQLEFSVKADEQGLALQKGKLSSSRIAGLLGEALVPELYDALPQEFAFVAGLAWGMPSLNVLRDQGPEAFLHKSDQPDSGMLLVWDIDPKHNSQVALIGTGSNPEPAQAFANLADVRSCETRARKKLWIVASHPDLGARIQSSCRNAGSSYRKLLEDQKPEQKVPQTLIALHPGEAIKSLYMLGGGHPSEGESDPASGKDAGRLQAKAEAMRQVTELSKSLPLIGYAGRAQADGSIQWQGF